MEHQSIVKLDQATRMLAEISTVDDAIDLIKVAEAGRVYARQVELGLEAQNHAAEIKLRAQRKAGELLDSMEKNKGAATRYHLYTALPPTLDEMGVSKVQSSQWQQIADIPDVDFEDYIEQTKEKADELTTAGIVREAKRINNPVLYSSESNQWNTPKHIVGAVVDVLEVIDLDPCSNDGEPNVPAITHYRKDDDGLVYEWAGRVYMNPPYGREIAWWVQKLVEEFELGEVTEAIALVPSRTDTEWFRTFREYPRCFIWGRLKFSDNGNSAPFPSMAVYLGGNVSRFVGIFGGIGDVYRRIQHEQPDGEGREG
jgi:hypothetical protein